MGTVLQPFYSKVAHSQFWIGSPASVISGTNMESRREMEISVIKGTGPLWLGSAPAVNQDNGTPLAVGDSKSIPFGGSVFLYGAGSGAGSVDVRIMEWG